MLFLSPFAGLRATNEDDADFNSKGLKPCTFVLSHSGSPDRIQMNKPQSIDGIIGPRHAGHMSHRAGVNRALKAEAAQSVRRAFNQDIADQLAADIDCTEHLSPVCDCHLHAGYDDAANLLADWRINCDPRP